MYLPGENVLPSSLETQKPEPECPLAPLGMRQPPGSQT